MIQGATDADQALGGRRDMAGAEATDGGMPRRAFVRRAALGAAALGLGLRPLARAAQEAGRRPNFVFFILDDMHYHMFNCLPQGRGKNLTPSIDRLAAEGTVMMGQHVSAPVCTPSRYNCLTGRYASRALGGQAEEQGQTVVQWNTHIRPGDVTLPRLLQQAGYATGFVGKNHVVHVPGFWQSRLPYEADPHEPEAAAKLAETAVKVRTAIREAGFDYAESVYNNNPNWLGPKALAAHNLDWIAQGALEFLDRYHERPFFLYFASTVPHGPLAPEQSWRADPRITADGYLEEPPDVLPPRETLRERVRQAGIKAWGRENLLWLDDAVGAVLDRLRRHGVLENTIVFFFNDHGQAAKGTLYQGGVSDPSIVWRSGGLPGGGTCETLVSNVDFAPTILDLAGAAVPPGHFDGVSFRPVLEGATGPIHDALYFEMGYTRAVRVGDWKYLALRYPQWAIDMPLEERRKRLEQANRTRRKRGMRIVTEDPTAPFSHIALIPGGGDAEAASTGEYPGYWDPDQLYNLADDPGEQHNMAGDPAHADRLAEMKAVLADYIEELPGGFGEFEA
jgi:arylsulfatase A-like enzyme